MQGIFDKFIIKLVCWLATSFLICHHLPVFYEITSFFFLEEPDL